VRPAEGGGHVGVGCGSAQPFNAALTDATISSTVVTPSPLMSPGHDSCASDMGAMPIMTRRPTHQLFIGIPVRSDEILSHAQTD